MDSSAMMIGQELRKLTHLRPFRAAVKDPAGAQWRRLSRILSDNQSTVFGQKHGFARISSIKDFQDSVPPANYEDLLPYIEAEMGGRSNQLTREAPILFATTSGTTAAPKFIPITPSHLRDYTRAFQIHNCQMVADHPFAALGKFMTITSDDRQGLTAGGIPYGAISGLLSRNQPGIIKRRFALPAQLSRIKDVDMKYYLMLRIAALEDVRAILCCNPSSLLLLCDQLRERAAEIISDIYQGKINRQHSLPLSLTRSLDGRLLPDRVRARELNRILEREGTLRPAHLWPNLSLISCWKGGPMSFYLDRLPDGFGDVPVRDFGYMASEGRGTIPLTDHGAGGVLAVTSHFFEFVPETDCGQASVFLTADRLELGARYYIYFTTASGLYRYNIDDLVEVVGFHERTPVLQFVRKGMGMSSITGEKLTEEQVRVALDQAIRQSGLTGIAHFTAAVQLGNPPYYACFVELAGELFEQARREFLHAFEHSLQAQNQEYRDKRASKRLGQPALHVVPAGTYDRIRQKRVSDGAPEAQVKIPLLARLGDFQIENVGVLP